MRAEEIKDAESLQAWLESLPQETEAERETARRWAMTIAHRAAMRVLPVFWDWQSESMQSVPEVEIVAFLRCLSTVHARLDWKDERKKSLLCKEAAASLRKRIGNEAIGAHGHAIQAAFYSCLAGAGADSPGSDAIDACLAAVDLYEKVLNDIGLVEDVFALNDMWDAGGAWEAVRTDCAILSKWSDLDWSPLWQLKRRQVQAWENNKSKILAQGEGWRFWVEWYENALYGRPQDYDLLTKIALIDPGDWDKGADHVNALIQRIVEQHTLAKDARALKDELVLLKQRLQAVEHRSHNNPPELVDETIAAQKEVTIIWAALDEAETELEKPDPDPSVLVRIGRKLVVAAKVVAAYCASLGDIAVKKVVATGAVGLTGIYLAENAESIVIFAERLLQFAKSLGAP